VDCPSAVSVADLPAAAAAGARRRRSVHQSTTVMDVRPARSTSARLQVLEASSSSLAQQLAARRGRRVDSSGVSYKLRPDAAAAAAAAGRLMASPQCLIMTGVCALSAAGRPCNLHGGPDSICVSLLPCPAD